MSSRLGVSWFRSVSDLKSVSATVASCNFAAPYADPVNGKLFATMKAWGKIAQNIAVWDYITNVKAYIILPTSLSPPSEPLAPIHTHLCLSLALECTDRSSDWTGPLLPADCCACRWFCAVPAQCDPDA